MRTIARCIFATLMITTLHAASARTPAPDGANLYIITPDHGAVVSSPVTVRFGLKGMGVAPSGVDRENTGHHHLLLDLEGSPAMDKPLPSNDHHHHFGGGQTETTLDLPPGKHTLQLIMGDHTHIPHEPPVMSEKITITVE